MTSLCLICFWSSMSNKLVENKTSSLFSTFAQVLYFGYLKSCQKVEKRRWRGKSKKMRTQKMHMFSHLITFTYLIFRKKKEKWSERNIPVDLLCPQGGRPLILWMTNGSSSHAGWIYDLQFLLSNPALHIQEKMLEIWVALTRENFKLECISASFLIKMQNPGVE